MKLIFLLLSFSPLLVKAQDQEITWKKVQIPYRYNLTVDIKEHKKCSAPNTLIQEVLKRNKINSVNDLKVADWVELPVCNGIETMHVSPPAEEPIKANFEEIKGWDEKITPKGYSLSQDLSDNQQCAKIWTKQIYEFQKKNPTVTNPNLIPLNKKIFVQRCYEIIQAATENKVLPPSKNEEEKKQTETVQAAITDYLKTEGTFDLYLGVSNYNNNLIQVLGAGVRGNIIDDKGYELKLFNFGTSILFIGELELKEKNNYKFQKTLSIGMSEYFLNETYPAVSGNTFYSTVGMIARPTPRWVAELELGAAFSGSFSPIIQTNAMKKFNNFWIGVFFEARSLNNALYQDRDNLIMSGLKLSF